MLQQAAELCDKGLQATDGSRHAPALLLIKGRTLLLQGAPSDAIAPLVS